MADNVYDPRRISSMPPATALDGTEVMEIVQDEENRQCPVALLVGAQGEPGVDGKNAYELAVLKGFVGTLTDYLESLRGLPGPAGEPGVAGTDGLSAYEVAVQFGFNGTEAEWLEYLQGPSGQSAYALAVSLGFNGTEAEWLLSLIGPKGDKGDAGLQGATGASAYELAVSQGYTGTLNDWLISLKGINGLDGKSAYQIALDNGFVGTEIEWLNSLKGVDGVDGTNGASAYQVAVINGYNGTEAEWVASLQGVNGLSAYELAVSSGYAGTEADWLASLKGDTGLSAYQQAVADGFVGTFVEWIDSLRGKSAYQTAVDLGFTGTEAEWLASLKGSAILINVNSFSASDFVAAPGMTVTKDYSDSSLRITHNLGKRPIGWFGVNHDAVPSTEMVVTSTRNLQVLDDNTVIITNVSSYEAFDIYLYFSDFIILSNAAGADGLSAYEIAVAGGFVGTEAEWLLSLKGDPGVDGAPGLPGADGSQGLSAYEVAVANGFTGTETDWLSQIYGGAIEVNVESFTSGTFVAPAGMSVIKEYSDSSLRITHNLGSEPIGWFAVGRDSAPATAIYATSTRNMQVDGPNSVIITNVSSFETFDVYLYFADFQTVATVAGADGASAYDIAVANGFVGTEAEWLASLIGADGQSVVYGGVPISGLAVSGAGVTATEANGVLTLDIPGGTSTTGGGAPVRSKIALVHNASNANVNIVGFGTQADADAITASVVNTGAAVRVVLADVPAGFVITSVSIYHEPGFNDTTGFELAYPDPFGDTSVLDMSIPTVDLYNFADPAVLQSAINQYFTQDTNLIVVGKSGVQANTSYRWKFSLN